MKARKTNLQRARRWCADQFSARHTYGEHCSHIASDILAEAEKRYCLDTYGVEGFIFDRDDFRDGGSGISYLNAGDGYAETILFNSKTHQFQLGCWADIAERYPNAS